jgi:hypothetical protein
MDGSEERRDVSFLPYSENTSFSESTALIGYCVQLHLDFSARLWWQSMLGSGVFEILFVCVVDHPSLGSLNKNIIN